MQVALIVMTILGCDDTASQCHYVATEQHQWTSVELCKLDTEKTLAYLSEKYLDFEPAEDAALEFA